MLAVNGDPDHPSVCVSFIACIRVFALVTYFSKRRANLKMNHDCNVGNRHSITESAQKHDQKRALEPITIQGQRLKQPRSVPLQVLRLCGSTRFVTVE